MCETLCDATSSRSIRRGDLKLAEEEVVATRESLHISRVQILDPRSVGVLDNAGITLVDDLGLGEQVAIGIWGVMRRDDVSGRVAHAANRCDRGSELPGRRQRRLGSARSNRRLLC